MRNLSEEVTSELRQEDAVMGRSEQLRVSRSRGENGPGMFKAEKEISVMSGGRLSRGCCEQTLQGSEVQVRRLASIVDQGGMEAGEWHQFDFGFYKLALAAGRRKTEQAKARAGRISVRRLLPSPR